MVPKAAKEEPEFEKKDGHYYSNSKYLADFGADSGVDKAECEDRCKNWKSKCPELCKEKKSCHLSDSDDGRFYTRDQSCDMECGGFNMHGDDKCTLFAENVELTKSGHGGNTFYKNNGVDGVFEAPKEEEKEEAPEEEEEEEEAP